MFDYKTCTEKEWCKMLRKISGKNRMRVLVFLTGVICLTAGLLNGGYQDALRKAILICLECIGIG